MSTNDFIRFLTQQFVKYVDEPRESRQEKRNQQKAGMIPRSVKWFGLVPMAISMLVKRK